jgi:methyl-accepting chemotaxis protein
VLTALNRSLAIIEFDQKGTILTANENFCNALGYSLSEIKGQHHSMFVDPDYVRSPDKAFWAKLNRGEFDAREYKRIGKGGREVWIQASYNPVINSKGTVLKIVKGATDITAEKLKNAEFEGKINAISRVQGIIEFTPGSEVITANENFLNLLGYRLDEIKGQHHRLFVEPSYAQSSDYQEFWRKLNAGEYIAAEFKRIGKGRKEVWIQASYNPIFDLNNKVMKMTKFATDITERVRAVNEIGAGLERWLTTTLRSGSRKPSFQLSKNFARTSTWLLRKCSPLCCRSPTARMRSTRERRRYRRRPTISRRTEQQAASLEETAAALKADQPDHWCYRRNRFSDESARFERRGRSGAGWRCGPRFCSRRFGSPSAGSALGGSGEGDQGADFGVIDAGRERGQAGE